MPEILRDGPMRLERELEVATRLAREAGAVLRRHRAGVLEVGYKAHGEVVTAADLEADALIRTGLKAAFPDDAIFSEESADTHTGRPSPRLWVVDPLDSTSNYTEHGDEYSVSIGLSVEGRAVLGVVYNPAQDELFAGYRGVGVTLNGSAVRASEAMDVNAARLTVSRKEWRHGLDRFAATLSIHPMASMAYKLARVAAGLDDAVFSMKPRKEWGTCAGVALVLAAGGGASLLDGEEIRFNRSPIRKPMGMVAAGPRLHPVLLEMLRRLPSPATDSADEVRREYE